MTIMSDTFMTLDISCSTTKSTSDANSASTSSGTTHKYATRNKAKQQSTEEEQLTCSELTFPPLEPLYEKRLPISVAKQKDLIHLCEKGAIPEEYHGWYKKFKRRHQHC